MEDLDAELLAVTEGKKSRGRGDSDNSSGGEFEGIADSDGGDDDDDDRMLDGGSDDEDEDDDFGLDDDDDSEYGGKKRKKPAAKKKKGRGRKKPEKKASESASDESEFEYQYDADGYGDAKDREKLMKMNEVDRETILTDRVEKRSRDYELWKMKKEMMQREKKMVKRSGRNRGGVKKDALKALVEDKKKKSSRALDEVSDADSEREVKREELKREDEEEEAMDTDEGPEMRYSDFVKDGDKGRETTPLFLRRDVLIRLSQQPFFERVVKGLFARVRSLGGGVDDHSYVLCRIDEVRKGDVYSASHDGQVKTNFYLYLHIGRAKKLFPIDTTSAGSPLEREFDVYRSRMIEAGYEMPRREEVEKLMKRAKEQVFKGNVQATEAENKKHITNMELCYPQRVNWTQKRTEVRTALEIKRMELSSAKDKDDDEGIERLGGEVEDLEKRLKEIERNEERYGVKSGKTDAQVFHSLARRNMALNTTNERLLARRRNLESGGEVNPFARFDTTGQSYFSIKGDAKGKEKEKERHMDRANMDWRGSLKSWRRGGKRKRIGDSKDKIWGVEVVGLEDFEGEGGSGSGSGSNGGKKGKIATSVDAVYGNGVKNLWVLPRGAKVISFEEWSRMRGN